MGEALSEAALSALEVAYEAGLAAERAGDIAAAAAAWRECLAIDPEDRGGAGVRLASLGQGPDPARAPPAYVATLFDQHAESFEMTLVHALGYAIPERIAEVVAALGRGPFARALDLGCGTGLAGEALEDMVTRIDGVDLSEAMLALADEKEIYADLFAGDAVAFLAEAPAQAYDLVVAADVLPYLGAVEDFAAGLSRVLSPGGLAAFSTETLEEAAFEGRPWRVGPNQRYAHEPLALAATLAAAGLTLRRLDPVVVRYESGLPVPGHLVVVEAEPG